MGTPAVEGFKRKPLERKRAEDGLRCDAGKLWHKRLGQVSAACKDGAGG